jgi:hypothetical protein
MTNTHETFTGHVRDSAGFPIVVGSRVTYFDATIGGKGGWGTVVAISEWDWDGDVDDYGRAVDCSTPPKVTVKWDDGDVFDHSTSEWEDDGGWYDRTYTDGWAEELQVFSGTGHAEYSWYVRYGRKAVA